MRSPSEKTLVRAGVAAVKMTPLGGGCFVLPANENAVELYVFSGASD